MKKVCFVAVNDFVVRAFVAPLAQALSEKAEVIIVGKVSVQELESLPQLRNCRIVRIDLERKIAPLADLKSLIQFARFFATESPDGVFTMVPKAGLIGMLAAFLTFTPTRAHYFVGLVWSNQTGLKALALKQFDKLIAFFANFILVDSLSQKDFLAKNGISKVRRIGRVLGFGSVCGVNTDDFRPDAIKKQEMRESLQISQEAKVILYMARITVDKGALVMAEAFKEIHRRLPDARLIVVGPEEEDGLIDEMKKCMEETSENVTFVDYTTRPKDYFQMADIFCMPSFREGLGMSTLCASSSCLPTLGSRIFGTIDAISEGNTGLIFEPGNSSELAKKALELFTDQALAERLGRSGRQMVLERFEEKQVVANFCDFALTALKIR